MAHVVFSLHLYSFLLLLFCVALLAAKTERGAGSRRTCKRRRRQRAQHLNLAACACIIYLAIGPVYGSAGAADRADRRAGDRRGGDRARLPVCALPDHAGDDLAFPTGMSTEASDLLIAALIGVGATALLDLWSLFLKRAFQGSPAQLLPGRPVVQSHDRRQVQACGHRDRLADAIRMRGRMDCPLRDWRLLRPCVRGARTRRLAGAADLYCRR